MSATVVLMPLMTTIEEFTVVCPNSTAASLFAAGAGTGVGAVVPAGVWVVCVMVLSTTRPEGDFLFAAGVGPYIYLLGGAMTAVICATVPQLPLSGPNTA